VIRARGQDLTGLQRAFVAPTASWSSDPLFALFEPIRLASLSTSSASYSRGE
jgi:hypothetical protein